MIKESVKRLRYFVAFQLLSFASLFDTELATKIVEHYRKGEQMKADNYINEVSK